MIKKAAFQFGMIKAARSYLTEEDRLERKMDRHIERGYEAERRRLKEKGGRQGRSTGRLTGGFLGASTGAIAGSSDGLPGIIIGGVGGLLGGALLGGALGKRTGRRAGIEEAKAREELAKRLRNMTPEQRRRYLGYVVGSQRASEMLEAQRGTVKATRANAMSNYNRPYYYM